MVCRAGKTLPCQKPFETGQVLADANPRPVTRDGITALLQAAWAGEAPTPLSKPWT